MSEPAGGTAPAPSQTGAPAESATASQSAVSVEQLAEQFGKLQNSVMRLTRLVGEPQKPSANPSQAQAPAEPDTLKQQLQALRGKLEETEKRAAQQARTAAVSSALGFLEKPAYVKAFTKLALDAAGDRLKIIAGETGNEVVYEDETGQQVPVEAFIAAFSKENALHELRPVQPVASRGMRPSTVRNGTPSFSAMPTEDLQRLTPEQRQRLFEAEARGGR